MSAPEKDERLESYADEIGMTEIELIEFCRNVLEDKGFTVLEEEPDGDENLTDCQRFKLDMEAAGYEVREYRGRFGWEGPSVYTNEKDGPTKTDVIRATKVKLNWDNMGLDWVVHPEEREGNWI